MPSTVRISDELFRKAQTCAKALNRSVDEQIEFWAGIGQIAEDNPDLPFSMIQAILIGCKQADAGELTPYIESKRSRNK